MTKLITNEYRQKLEKLHNENKKWGTPGPKFFDALIFLHQEKPKTVLDYGCGKGYIRNFLHGAYEKFTNYDPGIPKFSNIPTEKHDVVICVDVMEHVEENCLGAVLDHIRTLTNHKAFFYISCQKAKTHFPDGQNVHINIKTPEEWILSLSKYFYLLKTETKGLNKGLFYVGKPKSTIS